MAGNSWIILFLAGLLETCWVIGLKYSDGFTRPGASVLTIILMAGSLFLLSKALNDLPMGTAYAVWTGIGAVGAAAAGIILFAESREIQRVICILLIIAGIVGLKFSSGQ